MGLFVADANPPEDSVLCGSPAHIPQGSLSLKGGMVHTGSLPVDVPTCASPDLQHGDPRGQGVSSHLPSALARRLAHSRRSKKAL